MIRPLAACVLVASFVGPVHADDQVALPSPLRVGDVVRIAKQRRPEIASQAPKPTVGEGGT